MFKSGRKQSQGTVLDAVRCSSSTALSRGVFLNPNEVILGEPIALPLLSFLPASRLPSANFCIIHSFFLPRSRNKEIRDQKTRPEYLWGAFPQPCLHPFLQKGCRSAHRRMRRHSLSAWRALPAKHHLAPHD